MVNRAYPRASYPRAVAWLAVLRYGRLNGIPQHAWRKAHTADAWVWIAQ